VLAVCAGGIVTLGLVELDDGGAGALASDELELVGDGALFFSVRAEGHHDGVMLAAEQPPKQDNTNNTNSERADEHRIHTSL
jgi:hypothetical protein